MNDYSYTIEVSSTPEAAHAALTRPEELSAWWTRATGTGLTGGELQFWFDHASPCVMCVDEATESAIRWTVTHCDFLSEWVGTKPTFTLRPTDDGQLEVTFVHHGLTPELECIDMCTEGWNHFIPSLGCYLTSGAGEPLGSAGDLARRAARSSSSSEAGSVA